MVYPDSEDPEVKKRSYFFGIVHTLKENLIVIKTVLDQAKAMKVKAEEKRLKGLVEYAQPNSLWSVERMATTQNWQRQYLSFWSVTDLGFIQNHFLDASMEPNTPQDWRPYLNKVTVGESVLPCLVEKGIYLIEGRNQSGKSSMVPKIVDGYLQIKQQHALNI
mmetsp:Transcript_6777/g.11388  ORF Transcript_6777/g.11388 Transcript_6777/m.11388 type:complete len:163 (-) Transcript_6777:1651-2139(-)